jgi:hypothetical protein
MGSPKLSVHQCLKEIALCERKRKLSSRTASFLRHCVNAHLSEDSETAQHAYDKVLDMVLADMSPGEGTLSHEEVVELARATKPSKQQTDATTTPPRRPAAFTTVECAD